MGSLRFVIMKQVDKLGNEKVLLEYDQDVLKERLKAAFLVKLSREKRPFRGFKDETILSLASESFDQIVEEFKANTVRIQ